MIENNNMVIETLLTWYLFKLESPSDSLKLPTNCLSVFDHFVGLALKGLSANLQAPVNLF